MQQILPEGVKELPYDDRMSVKGKWESQKLKECRGFVGSSERSKKVEG